MGPLCRGWASPLRGNSGRPSIAIGRNGAPGSCSGGGKILAVSILSSCRAGKCSMHRSQTSKPNTSLSSLAAVAVLGLLRLYKVLLSPLFTGSCRFYPSCADYMREAIELHGAVKGVWMGTRRLVRCHPLGSHGVDPVPRP